MTEQAFEYDRYLIEQLVRPMVNLYRVTPLAAGETPAGPPAAFVRQKRMAFREDIRFFADESETQEVFRIKARRVIDIGGRYDVHDAAGLPIGVLEHQFGKSLLRSTWRILSSQDEELAVAQEKNQFLAILRRVADFAPYGEFLPIPYDFVIRSGERELGHFTRRFLSLRDVYTLDLSGDHEKGLDRRLAIALGIGLDALQNR
ncbi:MAG: hypothetical protein M3R39_05845 [Actinomycetota bacterium]|nr:hypothetical protein [Actinomycetota bacterium]